MLSSIGRTDIMLVYPNHTDIKIRKLNPNSEMSINIPNGLPGSREIMGMVLIARASPKMMSDSDSIRGLAIRGLVRIIISSKEESRVVAVHLKSSLVLTLNVGFN